MMSKITDPNAVAAYIQAKIEQTCQYFIGAPANQTTLDEIKYSCYNVLKQSVGRYEIPHFQLGDFHFDNGVLRYTIQPDYIYMALEPNPSISLEVDLISDICPQCGNIHS